MKQIAWFLTVVLLVNTTPLASGTDCTKSSQAPNTIIEPAAKAKAEVTKRRIGRQSRVRVTLKDGTEIKGYVSRVDENSFELTDQKSGKLTTVSYEHVSSAKGQRCLNQPRS